MVSSLQGVLCYFTVAVSSKPFGQRLSNFERDIEVIAMVWLYKSGVFHWVVAPNSEVSDTPPTYEIEVAS